MLRDFEEIMEKLHDLTNQIGETSGKELRDVVIKCNTLRWVLGISKDIEPYKDFGAEAEEKASTYKPLPENHPYKKPNKQGQIAINCLSFNNFGKHCWRTGDYEENATDCCVIKGEYCPNYKGGNNE